MNPPAVLRILRKNYQKAGYYLDFSNPLELLIAAILSAQCRDETVNKVTKGLFKKYRSARDYTRLDASDISKITLYNNKSKNIRAAAEMISQKFQGIVPQDMEGLTSIPGVGRKTANVILQNAFGIVEGIIVDTHVIRISYRLGWTKSKNPKIIEQDLMRQFPKSLWKEVPHLLKEHGRKTCKAQVPHCSKCPVAKFCPKTGVVKRI
jgi:endonuclease III